MLGTLLRNDKKEILSPASLYNPSEAIKEFTNQVRGDYEVGLRIQEKTYREFDGRSLIDVMDDDQRAFNTYVGPDDAEPDEAWRYKGTRPITRNKIISIVAHLTASILYPSFQAQNMADEEDKEVAEIMRDLVKWNIMNSDYEHTFLFAVISMCVNPAVILHARYQKVMQNIRVRLENGEITVKQACDEVLTGIKTHLVPVDELLIANVNEYYIQKQRFLIRRRFIDHAEARAVYGQHENFKYVKPGVRVFLDDSQKTFYEAVDEEMPTLDEEVVYYNRMLDLEVPFVNGIYMGAPIVEDNIMTHRRMTVASDGTPISVPIYPFAKSGAEPINDMRFFYYKSVVSKLRQDQRLVDTMWRMTVDGTFLEVMKPVITSGGGKIDTSVIFPGAVTDLPADAKIMPITGLSNPTAGYTALQSLEASMTESTQDKIQAGIIDTPSGTTAYQVATARQNAKIQLGMLGKMIAYLVKEYGELMVDCIIQHQTVAQAMDLVGDSMRLKFNKFIVPGKSYGGKQVSREIRFTEEMLGLELTEESKREMEWKLYREGGGKDLQKEIVLVNPYLFSMFKFKGHVDIDELLPQNEELKKAFNLELYDRAIQNPNVDQEKITRDFLLGSYVKSDADKYIAQAQPSAGPVQGVAPSNAVSSILGMNKGTKVM